MSTKQEEAVELNLLNLFRYSKYPVTLRLIMLTVYASLRTSSGHSSVVSFHSLEHLGIKGAIPASA